MCASTACTEKQDVNSTLKASFDMIDANGSGTIDAEEFGALLRLQGEDVSVARACFRLHVSGWAARGIESAYVHKHAYPCLCASQTVKPNSP